MIFANPTRSARAPQERGDEPMRAGVLTDQGVNGAELSSDQAPEIFFVRPIPGFADLRRFVLIALDGPDSVISELRSLERPEVRFVVATPAVFFSDYAIELDQQDCDHIGLTDAEDALILTVLTVGADVTSSTANLLAPIVINIRTRAALQVILTGSDWPVRAPLG
jgi:flagellar assembly factor FliW